MADRRDDVMQLPPGPVRVMDVVGDDDRKTHLLGQARCFGDQPVVIRQEMVFELEEETGRDDSASRRSSLRAARDSLKAALRELAATT